MYRIPQLCTGERGYKIVNILYPAGVKREWIDRNPVYSYIGYTANAVVPHAQTQRASYTVPAAKKAFLHSITLSVTRVTVAAPVGKWGAFTTLENGAVIYYIGENYKNSNAVYDSGCLVIAPNILLTAGDILKLYTIDTSTGGTVDYHISAAITEFDA